MEVRYLAHLRQLDALNRIPAIADDFFAATGRRSGGLVQSYRTEGAATIVVAMGSVLGTIKDAVDLRREAGESIGVVGITSFRPFPSAAVREALSSAAQVVVVEKAFSIGHGGVLATDVAMALRGTDGVVREVVAGLGGRPITQQSLDKLFYKAAHGELDEVLFLDLESDVVQRELARMRANRRSGPSAENVLRDVGATRGEGAIT